MAILEVPALAKYLGVPNKIYEKEKDIIPIKEKFRQKRDKDKNIFSFSKNLLNRNAIKRKNMGIRGYFAAPKAPQIFLG